MSELIYVRFKRQKQTVFLWCNPSETTLKAKERLAKIVDRDPADIKLYGADKSTGLEEAATFADAQIESDAVMYWVERSGGNDFEEINCPALQETEK